MKSMILKNATNILEQGGGGGGGDETISNF